MKKAIYIMLGLGFLLILGGIMLISYLNKKEMDSAVAKQMEKVRQAKADKKIISDYEKINPNGQEEKEHITPA